MKLLVVGLFNVKQNLPYTCVKGTIMMNQIQFGDFGLERNVRGNNNNVHPGGNQHNNPRRPNVAGHNLRRNRNRRYVPIPNLQGAPNGNNGAGRGPINNEVIDPPPLYGNRIAKFLKQCRRSGWLATRRGRGLELQTVLDLDYLSCVDYVRRSGLRSKTYVKDSIDSFIKDLSGSNNLVFIMPTYTNCIRYTYSKGLSWYYRTDSLSGKKDVLPRYDLLLGGFKKNGKSYTVQVDYTTERWMAVRAYISHSGIELGHTRVGLTDYFRVGRYFTYFSKGHSCYIDKSLVDKVCCKFSCVKVTPSLMKSVAYYTRKYSQDDGYLLTPSELNSIVKLVITRITEVGALALGTKDMQIINEYNSVLNLETKVKLISSKKQIIKKCISVFNKNLERVGGPLAKAFFIKQRPEQIEKICSCKNLDDIANGIIKRLHKSSNKLNDLVSKLGLNNWITDSVLDGVDVYSSLVDLTAQLTDNILSRSYEQ